MTQVIFKTDLGDITIEVDHENAPIGAEKNLLNRLLSNNNKGALLRFVE